MVAALSEKFDHLVERLIVIDCRYPYEFEGGHIKVGASPTGFEPLVLVLSPAVSPSPPGSPEPAPGGPRGGFPPQIPHRPILLGQTRGHHLPLRVLVGARPADVRLRPQARPRPERLPQAPLPRALRPEGRIQGVLPQFQGYFGTVFLRALVLVFSYGFFFLTSLLPSQERCEPQSYRPMLHKDFKEDLKKFRCKSRTWAGERSKQEMYNRLKKL